MRSNCKGPPSSGIQKPCAWHRHHLHGRPGGHLENDLRRSGTRPEIHDHGQETHRRPPSERARSQIEIRWCPSHQGIEGNEVADEPDAHGVEWFNFRDPRGQVRKRKFPLPRSLPKVKRGFSEKKWAEAKGWAKKRLPSEKQKPDPTVVRANKRLASRFYQLKTGHFLTGHYLTWTS